VLSPINYVGRSPQQVEEFIDEHVKPVLEKNKVENIEVELRV
jgi:adenylosuccinate lyase